MKDRLKELRKALGIKQRELAERLGVKVSLIGNWEIGKQTIPQTRIYQICKEYNVRREWLETGEGEMFEPLRFATFEEQIVAMYAELPEHYQRIWLEVAEKLIEAGRNPRKAAEAVEKALVCARRSPPNQERPDGTN